MNVTSMLRWSAITALLACAGCSDEATDSQTAGGSSSSATDVATDAPAWFVEEANARGIEFKHVMACAERGDIHMPDMIAGGGGLLDADRDGDLDLYLVQTGDYPVPDPKLANRFFVNDGRGDFEDATATWGGDDSSLGIGMAVGDANGDGWEDLFVTNFGPDRLYLNQAGKRFEQNPSSGTEGDGFSTSAVFFDSDVDGDLDLFVLDYLIWNFDAPKVCQGKRGGIDYCGPKSVNTPTPDHFYVNDGTGTFVDASVAAGISLTAGTGLGVLAGDFDADGWQDLFVANDGWPDRLWNNQHNNTFVDIAMRMGCAVDETGSRKAGMGVTAADIDDDGDLDLAVCNLGGETDAIYRNEGTYFLDQTARIGVAQKTKVYTRFGMGWVDFDNDGWLDLYQANGCVQRPDVPQRSDDPYAQENTLMRGGRQGKFSLVAPTGGTSERLLDTSRGAIFGDVDNDGAQDIVVVNRGAKPYLLHNTIGGGAGWIILDVREASGAVALGATVTLQAGERTLTRDVRAAYSYVVSNDPRVHVGLGSLPGVTQVRVLWSDGTEEAFDDLDSGQVVTLSRGKGN